MGWENGSKFTDGSVIPKLDFDKVQHNFTG